MVVELRLLREEVAALRQELRLIEHKPEHQEVAPPPADPAPAPLPASKAESFGDLLANWD